jgi:DNA-binding transcriptional MerR regulator
MIGGPGIRFDDGKEPGALRTIGEVAAALGLRQHVLRYWEEQFPMLRPVKRSGGRRYYRPEDVALVARIDHLVHREGYTLKGARKALGEPAPAEVTPVAGASAGRPEPAEVVAVASDLVPRLRALRHRLAEALAAA